MMKKYIDVAVSFLWFILLAALMLRMPVIRLLKDPTRGFASVDLVLSAFFCFTGVVAPLLAYLFSKKQLFSISLVNTLLFAMSIVLIVISTVSKNGQLFDFSCYFVNLFCFVFSIEWNMIAVSSAFLRLQIVSTVVFFVLFKIRKEK